MPLQDDRASQIEVPQAAYKVRVMEAEKGISQLKTDETTGKQTGNNPRITLTLEIFDAAPVEIRNHETGETDSININGLQFKQWITLTEKALGPVNTIKKALGMPQAKKETISLEESELFKGKVGDVILKGSRRIILDANKQPIINPHTGQSAAVPDIKVIMWLAP